MVAASPDPAADMPDERCWLWVQDKAALRLSGRPYRPGLPLHLRHRLIHVAADRPEDALIDESNRRYSALAIMLRSRYLVDVDCWSEARGQPIKPGDVLKVMKAKLSEGR